MNVLEPLFREVWRAARRLMRDSGFTATAIVTLAIGIGATTAIFSIVYGVVIKPLPFDEPQRLVAVWHQAPGINLPLLQQSPATYLTYRESGHVFEDIGMWDATQVSVTDRGDPERVQALLVTDGFLPVLRVQPSLGRLFSREDDSPGSPSRVVLTYGYWQRKFGGATDAIGQNLKIDGTSREVIGVLPPTFRFLRTDAAVLLPFQLNRARVFVGNFTYQAVARLKQRVTVAQANADVARMIPLVFERFPMIPGNTRKMFEEARLGPNVRPLAVDVVGDVGRLLWILFGSAGIMLLIAAANLANLFLVRVEGQHENLAIRAALGASRARLAYDLLIESVGLTLSGGAFGVFIAWLGIRVLIRIAPAGLPRLGEIGINPIVLAFTLAVSILTGLLVGLIPLAHLAKASIEALKEGGRSVTGAPSRRMRSAFVVSELALAMVLLIVSGLMVRTFVALRQVDPGFVAPDKVQTFRVSVNPALPADPLQVARMYETIAEHLQQLPGVQSVGVSSSVTMDGTKVNHPILIESHPDVSRRLPPLRRFKRIAPGYFETMGNRILAGRSINWTDIYEVRPVAMISQNLARQFWKSPADAIGKRIREMHETEWREIIGVVGDERDDGLDQSAPTSVFWPLLLKDPGKATTSVDRNTAYMVRSDRVGSPGFVRELQQAVWSVNPTLPLANVQTLTDIRGASMAQTSFALTMLIIAAAVTLSLGIVGTYAVVAYMTAQRSREIGIRMALGAQSGDVCRMFLRHGLLLTAIGILIGISAAAALTRTMSTLLFGVNPIDPMTYTVAAVGLGAIALVSAYLPARRASHIDPVEVLRSTP